MHANVVNVHICTYVRGQGKEQKEMHKCQSTGAILGRVGFFHHHHFLHRPQWAHVTPITMWREEINQNTKQQRKMNVYSVSRLGGVSTFNRKRSGEGVGDIGKKQFVCLLKKWNPLPKFKGECAHWTYRDPAVILTEHDQAHQEAKNQKVKQDTSFIYYR